MKTEKKANITTIPFLGDIILSGSRTLIGIALGLLTSGIPMPILSWLTGL